MRGALLYATLCLAFSMAAASPLRHGGWDRGVAVEGIASTSPGARRLLEVEIDAIVIYLLGAVCAFAFLPPCICKLRQMFCTSEEVSDEYEE
jgi:hypothetical protein